MNGQINYTPASGTRAIPGLESGKLTLPDLPEKSDYWGISRDDVVGWLRSEADRERKSGDTAGADKVDYYADGIEKAKLADDRAYAAANAILGNDPDRADDIIAGREDNGPPDHDPPDDGGAGFVQLSGRPRFGITSGPSAKGTKGDLSSSVPGPKTLEGISINVNCAEIVRAFGTAFKDVIVALREKT